MRLIEMMHRAFASAHWISGRERFCHVALGGRYSFFWPSAPQKMAKKR